MNAVLAEYVKQVVNESERSHPFSDGSFFNSWQVNWLADSSCFAGETLSNTSCFLIKNDGK
jgi:hypothetical protein